MKTYQAEISYRYIQPIGPGKVIDRNDVWTSTRKYATREEAQAVLDKDVASISQQYEVYYGKVIEGEQDDTLVMEGLVGDNGCDYEDYALILIDEQGPGYSKLIENEIGSAYKGRRVRITVELID
jgi:hypothetical protein